MKQSKKPIEVLIFAFPDGTVFWRKEKGCNVQKTITDWKNSLDADQKERYSKANVTSLVGKIFMLEKDFEKTKTRIHLLN